MRQLARLAGGFVIVFTLLIVVAMGVGSRAELPPIRLIHEIGSIRTEVYIDVIQNRETRRLRPLPDLPPPEYTETLIFSALNGEVQLILDDGIGWFFNLTVIQDGVSTHPIEDLVFFPNNFHSPDERFWYFVSYNENEIKKKLIQFDAKHHEVKIVLEDVNRSLGCSEIDPVWCIVDTSLGNKLYVLNLDNGTTQYLDLIPLTDRNGTFSHWMPDTNMYLYSVQPPSITNRKLIAYDPVTDTKHTIYEMPWGHIIMNWSVDPHRIKILSYDSSGNTLI